MEELQELSEGLSRIEDSVDRLLDSQTITLNKMIKTEHVDINGVIHHLHTKFDTYEYNDGDELKLEVHEICVHDNFCVTCNENHEENK